MTTLSHNSLQIFSKNLLHIILAASIVLRDGFRFENYHAINFRNSKFINCPGALIVQNKSLYAQFDHYATVCELLPCSIPSLCLCLKTWLSGGYNQDIHSSVSKLLGYSENNEEFMSTSRQPLLSQLSFPGWQLFMGLEWFINLRVKHKNIVDSDQVHTWFNQWQVLNNYTNPMQIDTFLPVISEILVEVVTLETHLKTHLEQTYYPHTTEEIIGTLILPIKEQLNQLKSDCETQIALGCRVRGQKRLTL